MNDITTTWADQQFATRTAALNHIDQLVMAIERYLPRLPYNERQAGVELIELLWVARADLIVAGPKP